MTDLLELTRQPGPNNTIEYFLDVTQDYGPPDDPALDTTTLVIPMTYIELRRFGVLIERMLNGESDLFRLEIGGPDYTEENI